MARLYKITNDANRTRGGMQWGINVTNAAVGPENGPLCSSSWIHAYEDLAIAELVYKVHLEFSDIKIWEAEGDVGIRDGLKCGCRSLTTIKELDRPVITTEQRIRFAIGCAWQVSKESDWQNWALAWLQNKDRTGKSAADAYAAVHAASAASYIYADAADADTYAADAAAAYAAAATYAAYAAYAATYAAYAADINKSGETDFTQIARWALSNSLDPEEIKNA